MRTTQFISANGDRSNIPNKVLVLNNAYYSGQDAQYAASVSSGVYFYGVALTNQVPENIMQGIVSSPKTRNQQYFMLNSANDLANNVANVGRSVCINYGTPGPPGTTPSPTPGPTPGPTPSGG